MAEKNEQERVSVNPFGVDEHRVLTTGDLDNIAEYVKGKNKSSSSSSSSSRKSSSSKSKKSGGSK